MLRAGRVTWLKAGAVAFFVLCLDLGSKALVSHAYPLNERHELVSFLSAFPVHNPGISLSPIGGGVHLPMYALFAVVALVCVNVIVQPPTRGLWVVAGLALGGSLGNLLELVYHGYATDFIHINGSGVAFNFADLAITTALLMGMVVMFVGRQPGVSTDSPDVAGAGS